MAFPYHTNLHMHLSVFVFRLQMFKNRLSVAFCTYTCNKINGTCIYTHMLHEICKNSDTRSYKGLYYNMVEGMRPK